MRRKWRGYNADKNRGSVIRNLEHEAKDLRKYKAELEQQGRDTDNCIALIANIDNKIAELSYRGVA